MRIGLFTDVYPPKISGVSTSVALLKKMLGRRGHTVYVFTTSDPDASRDEVNIIRVPSLPFASSKRIAINYDPLLHHRVADLDLDIIHTHTEFGLGIFGRNIAKMSHIPHVHTYHTVYEEWVRGTLKLSKGGVLDQIGLKYIRLHSRYFCDLGQAVIAPTQKTKDILQAYGVHKPIRIIPSGIDLRRFRESGQDLERRRELRAELGIAPDAQVLLFLGRLSVEKSIEELMDYFTAIHTEYPELRLLLVGDGPSRNGLQRIAHQRRIADKVIFTGECPMDAVPDYYAMSDIFLSASTSETQGLTYIEAMATGLPILVRRDPCLSGVFTEGKSGFSYTTDDEFMDKLRRLLAIGPDKREEIRQAALRDADVYSMERYAERVEDLYRELIREGRS